MYYYMEKETIDRLIFCGFPLLRVLVLHRHGPDTSPGHTRVPFCTCGCGPFSQTIRRRRWKIDRWKIVHSDGVFTSHPQRRLVCARINTRVYVCVCVYKCTHVYMCVCVQEVSRICTWPGFKKNPTGRRRQWWPLCTVYVRIIYNIICEYIVP